MTVLIHHDHPEHWEGFRLAVTSVLRHCPGEQILASCPNAPAGLVRWLSEICTAGVYTGPDFAGIGWDVKPKILLWALDLGHEQVLWLDADIIVATDFRSRLPPDPSIFVASEEYAFAGTQGSEARTAAWNLPKGRTLKRTVNSGVIRVGQHHRKLLEDWAALLLSPEYRVPRPGYGDKTQTRHTGHGRRLRRRRWQFSLSLATDQCALTALLGSAQYEDLCLHLLRSGRDIAQCCGPSGFTPLERVGSLLWGPPPLVHAQGVKPWYQGAAWRRSGSRMGRLRIAYEDVHLRLSPYSIAARQIAEDAGVSRELCAPRNAMERVLLRLGQRWPQLPELPLAILDAVGRRMRKWLGI